MGDGVGAVEVRDEEMVDVAGLEVKEAEVEVVVEVLVGAEVGTARGDAAAMVASARRRRKKLFRRGVCIVYRGWVRLLEE